MAESGRCGASPKSLLKDLSEAGRTSRNDLAYISILISEIQKQELEKVE